MSTITLENEPPSYIDPPAFTVDGELPEYHRNAAADERIVLAQPRAPITTTRAHTEYVFKTPRLELNLGEKKWPVKVPCYGWKGTVKGSVLVKDFKAVTRITVTVSLSHLGCFKARHVILVRGRVLHKRHGTRNGCIQLLEISPVQISSFMDQGKYHSSPM
jgi:hypothetical protein